MIRRVNLYFNLQREQDRIVYEKISSLERNVKSAFVIQTIFDSLNQHMKLDKKVIKEAVREVLDDILIVSVKPTEDEKKIDIPEEIFDMFDKL